MRDFLTPMTCGDGENCGCGDAVQIPKEKPDSGCDCGDSAQDEDCGDDCACHDNPGDCGCSC